MQGRDKPSRDGCIHVSAHRIIFWPTPVRPSVGRMTRLTMIPFASPTVLDGSTSTVNFPPLRVLTVNFIIAALLGALWFGTTERVVAYPPPL